MQTERAYLVGLGLAQPGRGRFSIDAVKALNAAKEMGMKFAGSTSRTPPPTGASPSYNAAEVRKWAATQGITLGARGRISADVVAKFYEEEGAVVTTIPEVATPAAPVEPVREETVAYGLARRGEDDPEYISEPVVGFTNCGRCGNTVATCACSSGPWVPTYLTNGVEEQASLTNPAE